VARLLRRHRQSGQEERGGDRDSFHG
jgi:hypothetical protein